MHPGKLIVQIAIERGAPFGPRRITALSSLTGRSSSTKNGFFEIVDNSNEVPKVHWTIYK
jgi:hypothetical protein